MKRVNTEFRIKVKREKLEKKKKMKRAEG